MDDAAADTRVEWREWGQAAFDEADRAGTPLLLALTASWSPNCREMDRRTYAEPRIAANCNDGFVPVRVDVDRHPRVAERYNMGGFPSTVFLTPEGEVLTGAGFLSPDGMRQAIDGVRRMWDAKGSEAGRVPRAVQGTEPPAGDLEEGIEERMVGQLRASYDEVNGGWGEAEKYPMPRTVEFALKREREMAERTLNAVSANLLDDYAGGFFRHAANADWSGGNTEKLLDTNAALVRTFAHAYCYTGRDEYREPAARTVAYLTTTLWNGEAFAASQAGDRDYYTAEATDREAADAPPVDEVALADWNAMAVDALLTYHGYTDDEEPRRFAERALDYLREDLVDGDRVVHYRDGDGTGERGLLADHARVVSALTTARSVTGAETLETATALADHVLDDLGDGASFTDGPASGPGLLDRPLRPLDGNVEFADALVDLAVHTGEERYREAARRAVEAFAGASDRFGVRAAAYAGVAARCLRPPLVVEVGSPAGSDLHRAALRVADHEKVVLPGVGSVPDGEALVRTGDAVSEPASTPAELTARVAEHVR